MLGSTRQFLFRAFFPPPLRWNHSDYSICILLVGIETIPRPLSTPRICSLCTGWPQVVSYTHMLLSSPLNIQGPIIDFWSSLCSSLLVNLTLATLASQFCPLNSGRLLWSPGVFPPSILKVINCGNWGTHLVCFSFLRDHYLPLPNNHHLKTIVWYILLEAEF